MSQYLFNICLSKSNKLNFSCIYFLSTANSDMLLPQLFSLREMREVMGKDKYTCKLRVYFHVTD